MVIVELKRYGDFDMIYTDSIWINPDMNAGDWNRSDAETLSNICYKDKDTKQAERYLSRNGFKKINTLVVTIGGYY